MSPTLRADIQESKMKNSKRSLATDNLNFPISPFDVLASVCGGYEKAAALCAALNDRGWTLSIRHAASGKEAHYPPGPRANKEPV